MPALAMAAHVLCTGMVSLLVAQTCDCRGALRSVTILHRCLICLRACSHAIVSSTVGPEYYVGILSFVDKSQLEPGCSVLLHNKVSSSREGSFLARAWKWFNALESSARSDEKQKPCTVHVKQQ